MAFGCVGGIRSISLKKVILFYSLGIALSAFVLQWLEYQYAIRYFSTEIYIAVIALSFTALGIWVGIRLTAPRPQQPFEKNIKAMTYLGISDREYEVLELLAAGHSNKEIADSLFVSTNTVKTHLANLYSKLEVTRRTQAVHKAKTMQMIP